MGKLSLAGLLCVFTLVFTGFASAEMFLSVPSDVSEGQNATFRVESSEVRNFNFSLNISGPEGSYFDSFSASDGVGSKTLNLSSEGFSEGDYSVAVSAFNRSTNFSDSSRSDISVSSSVSGIKIVSLTSKSISESECPLRKSQSLAGSCKIFEINTTLNQSSNLSELSKSGKPLTASVNQGRNYVGLIDSENPEDYDTVFWDDDPVFREQNETGRQERSSISPGEPVKRFSVDGQPAYLNTMIVGNDVVLTVPQTSSEFPARKGDTLTYAFLAYRQADKLLGSAVNVDPVKDVDVRAFSRSVGADTSRSITPQDSVPDHFGLTGIGQISAGDVGKHKININNISSQYYEVKTFDIGYRIKNPSTGRRENTFRPGETVKLDVVPTLNDEKIVAENIEVELIDPSGNSYERTLQNSNSVSFDLPEDVSAGRATVSIEVENDEGVVQSKSVGFDVKKFEVHTIPLRATNTTALSAETFAPGSEGYALVNAVQLGTFGGVDEITDAQFYDIDNSSTSKDECKRNVGSLKGQIEGSDALTVLNKTSVADSSIFSSKVKQNLPEKLKTQCVVKFELKNNLTGSLTGSVSVQRLQSNQTQIGDVSFDVTEFRMRGSSVDPATGAFEYEFGVNSQVGIEPEVSRIGTYSRVEDSKILDASVLNIRGQQSETSINSTYNSSGDNILSFQAPDSSGDYTVEFTAEVNTTDSPDSTQTVTGTAYFNTKVFDVQEEIVQPETSYRVPPQSNVTIAIKSTDLSSGEGVSGLTADVAELENGEQQTNYLDNVNVSTGVTDENGTAKITLIPVDEWSDGYYTGEVEVSSPRGKTDTAFLYFRVDKYNVEIDTGVNGNLYDQYESSGIVSGDSIQLIPEVYENTRRSSDFIGRRFVEDDIDIEDSDLVYYGSGIRYSSSEVSLSNKSEVVEIQGNQVLNLSTENLEPGSYRVNLGLGLENGEKIRESSYFDLNAFALNVSKANNQDAFQPGSNVTYYVNTSVKSDYKLGLDELESYSYRDQQTSEMNLGISKEFTDTSSMAFNVSLQNDSKPGSYSGNLKITSGGSTQYENINLDVETKGLSIPKTAQIRFNTDYKLEARNETFYEDLTTDYMAGVGCQQILQSKSLGFEPSDLSSENCSVTSNNYEDFNVTWIDQSKYESWNDSRVFITEDSQFNESGDVASNSTLYQPVTFPNGLKLNITKINRYELTLTPMNGFLRFGDDIIVERNADSYFYSGIGSTVSESDYRIDADINGDGDTEDKLKLMLVNNSNTFSTRASFNNNFTSENSTDIGSSGIRFGGTKLYVGELRNSTEGYIQNLILPTPSEVGNVDAKLAEGNNYTFPVVATYPNGTPVQDQEVGVSKFIRESSGSVSSKVFNGSKVTATTDSNGLAFINTELPDIGSKASASYKIVPNMSGTTGRSIERFSAPEATVSKLTKISKYFSRVEIGETNSYSDQDKAQNAHNLEQGEGITLVDEDYNSTEYRFTQVNESIDSACYDILRNLDCDRNISILMYDDGYPNVQGVDTNEILIDDDSIFGQNFDGETGEDEQEIDSEQIFANYSSIGFEDNDLQYVDVFSVFNESNDTLSFYTDEVHSNDNVYLTLKGTRLFTNTPLTGRATVSKVSYDGETYNATSDLSKPLTQGFALFNLSRSDFEGSETSWRLDTPVSLTGTLNGTVYTQLVRIEEEEEDSSLSGSGASGGTIS